MKTRITGRWFQVVFLVCAFVLAWCVMAFGVTSPQAWAGEVERGQAPVAVNGSALAEPRDVPVDEVGVLPYDVDDEFIDDPEDDADEDDGWYDDDSSWDDDSDWDDDEWADDEDDEWLDDEDFDWDDDEDSDWDDDEWYDDEDSDWDDDEWYDDEDSDWDYEDSDWNEEDLDWDDEDFYWDDDDDEWDDEDLDWDDEAFCAIDPSDLSARCLVKGYSEYDVATCCPASVVSAGREAAVEVYAELDSPEACSVPQSEVAVAPCECAVSYDEAPCDGLQGDSAMLPDSGEASAACAEASCQSEADLSSAQVDNPRCDLPEVGIASGLGADLQVVAKPATELPAVPSVAASPANVQGQEWAKSACLRERWLHSRPTSSQQAPLL